MAQVGYPAERVHYHPGLVEETIPGGAPEQIALLRLDTDWYASTKHELEHLYDRVRSGGVVIIDDYDYWEGSRKAVDEFVARDRRAAAAGADGLGADRRQALSRTGSVLSWLTNGDSTHCGVPASSMSGIALQRLLEQDLQLEPRQRGAEAEVPAAGAERLVLGVARDVEAVRVLVDAPRRGWTRRTT